MLNKLNLNFRFLNLFTFINVILIYYLLSSNNISTKGMSNLIKIFEFLPKILLQFDLNL